MSIIQKAIKHNKEISKNLNSEKVINKEVINENYGINNLFSNKSKKKSFIEFGNGIKDILLGALIFIPKICSAIFDIVKRPGYALSLLFALIITSLIVALHEDSHYKEKNIAAIRNAKFIKIDQEIKENSVFQEKALSKGAISLAENSNIERTLKHSRSFESKVSSFFSENKISDLLCKDGHCRLKIGNSIFCEHSALCECPTIILESSNDNELVFSDGAGNYCTMEIERLLQ